MFTLTRRTALALATLAALATPSLALADDITVFAASSLKTALDQIVTDYAATGGDKIVVSYDSSAKLAKQIQEGAPADIFFSAAKNWMDTLADAKLIQPDTRHDLLGNTLILAAHGADAKPVTLTDLPTALGDGKLAMGLVDSVPAGQYGKEALTSLGLWDKVQAQVAQAENVRAALKLVASGEAPYGIVFGSDAVSEPDVSVAATFPADSHKPIVYPAALTATAKPAAQAFLDYLASDKAGAVFAAQGFTVLK